MTLVGSIMCEVDGLPEAGCLVFRVGKWGRENEGLMTKSSEWIEGLVIKYSFSWAIHRCRRRF